MSAPVRGLLDGITRIGVVGAGQMGRGIAQLAASHGFAVTLADAQREIAAAGKTLRVYVPYGDQWYGYFMRRLAERPANIAFFLRSLATKT